MNIANQLTILRILLSFVCVFLISSGTLVNLFLGLLFFFLASLTDFFDGYFARRRNIVSDFGRLMDPVADKILVIGVFLAFLRLNIVSAAAVTIIVFREFLVTGLRLYALSKNYVLEAKSFGKHKTFTQMAGIVIIIIILLMSKLGVILSSVAHRLIFIVVSWIVIVTIFSGGMYLWKNRKLIKSF